MKSEKGFTLIELMIVILIIAILVAIAIPVYLSIQNGANNNTAKDNMRTIDGAISAYNAYTGTSTITNQSAWLVPTMLKTWPSGPAGYVYSLSNGSASCTGITGY